MKDPNKAVSEDNFWEFVAVMGLHWQVILAQRESGVPVSEDAVWRYQGDLASKLEPLSEMNEVRLLSAERRRLEEALAQIQAAQLLRR